MSPILLTLMMIKVAMVDNRRNLEQGDGPLV